MLNTELLVFWTCWLRFLEGRVVGNKVENRNALTYTNWCTPTGLLPLSVSPVNIYSILPLTSQAWKIRNSNTITQLWKSGVNTGHSIFFSSIWAEILGLLNSAVKLFDFNGFCSWHLTVSVPDLSNMALKVTSLQMLSSHNYACIVCLHCHLFSKGYGSSVFVCRLLAGPWTAAAIINSVISKILSNIKDIRKKKYLLIF